MTTKVQLVEINASFDGQRIDNYLMTRLKGVPKSHIYRLLRTGQVRINKGRIKPAYRLKSGDIIRIPPVNVAADTKPARPGDKLRERIRDSLIYEDDHLIVINKPSGIAVHSGSGIEYGAIEILRSLYGDQQQIDLVHRLDRETSGCLLITRNRKILPELHNLIRQGDMEKRYLTLLKGKWQGGTREINFAMNKQRLVSGEAMVQIHEDGKPALSIFSPEDIFSYASLMDVTLVTGRTHQIRVHATHTGHPVAGDEKYGNRDFNRHMRSIGLKRLFLHAHQLEFNLPASGKEISITAPLDDELNGVVNKLEKNEI
ncbi:MAG: RluA family pseudouridine synthase [Gammaproteobacteria bacterium]